MTEISIVSKENEEFQVVRFVTSELDAGTGPSDDSATETDSDCIRELEP